jgi:hypothetical protein
MGKDGISYQAVGPHMDIWFNDLVDMIIRDPLTSQIADVLSTNFSRPTVGIDFGVDGGHHWCVRWPDGTFTFNSDSELAHLQHMTDEFEVTKVPA